MPDMAIECSGAESSIRLAIFVCAPILNAAWKSFKI